MNKVLLASFILCQSIFLTFATILYDEFVKSDTFSNNNILLSIKERKTAMRCLSLCAIIKRCSMVTVSLSSNSFYLCQSYQVENDKNRTRLIHPSIEIWYRYEIISTGGLTKSCPEAFTIFGNRCYSIIGPVNWDEAKTYCNDIASGGHLVELSDVSVSL